MPEAAQIDAPLSLGSFFPPESDEESETELDQCFETQEVCLVEVTLRIRQFAYHSHNANRVWPGTFNLAEHLLAKSPDGGFRHSLGSVLELGTATGLLAIRLALASKRHGGEDQPFLCNEVVTSDVADDEIEDCVEHNFKLNGFVTDRIPVHVPHTWGSGWRASASTKSLEEKKFDTIVASDILLYVSAYPALVVTLQEVMEPHSKFIMSWNRRMKESSEFFERMEAAGFDCHHEGKCVYTFVHATKRR